jgi:hypothetical protein
MFTIKFTHVRSVADDFKPCPHIRNFRRVSVFLPRLVARCVGQKKDFAFMVNATISCPGFVRGAEL